MDIRGETFGSHSSRGVGAKCKGRQPEIGGKRVGVPDLWWRVALLRTQGACGERRIRARVAGRGV